MSACASIVPRNTDLSGLSAEERVAWSLENLPGQHIVSSSFGAHAAVSLHLLTQQKPDIPVVLIDTGYLFPETYRFVDRLTEFPAHIKHARPRESNPSVPKKVLAHGSAS